VTVDIAIRHPRPALIKRYAPAWPYIRWGLFALGVAWSIGIMVGLLPWDGTGVGFRAGDLRAYWVADVASPYGLSEMGTPDAYLYSPAFLQAFSPLQLVPWEAVQAVMMLAHFAAIAWLAPWMMVFPGVIDDTVRGNVNTFLGLAIVLGLRYNGAAWAFVLLTKVTPAVGIAWHLVRREWGPLAQATVATAAIVAVSLILNPVLWGEWIGVLASNDGAIAIAMVPGPLPLRVLAGVGLVMLGAWRGWAWMVPVGSFVAMPNTAPQSSAILAAVPKLTRPSQKSR
jgi:hypothetical protein